MRRRVSKAEVAIHWIQHFCVQPSGQKRGQRVKLTARQRDCVSDVLEGLTQSSDPALNAYLALLRLCGPRALADLMASQVETDSFTIWAATSPDLQKVLKRDGERILCPQLQTSWPSAA